MSPWKHLSIHALEQAYIRLGIDCYALLSYLATTEIKEVSREWATRNFNIIRQSKRHKYYIFKAPETDVDVLALTIDGVVLTFLTHDLAQFNLKDTTRNGSNSVVRTLEGSTYEYKGI